MSAPTPFLAWPISLLVAVLAPGCVIPESVGIGTDDTGPGSTSSDPSEDGMPPGATSAAGSTGPTSTGDSEPSTGAASTGASDDTGMLFLMIPDGGVADPECDIWAQDCPEGMKCMPSANDGGDVWNYTRCSTIDPQPDAVGEPCVVEDSGTSGIDSCELGAMCWDVDPKTLEGTCVAMCEGDEANPICEPEGTACAIANDGVVILCLPVCNPALPDCPEGQACYPLGDQFFCAPAADVDPGGLGESCEDVAVCDPGLFCAQPELVPDCASAGCCTPFCDVTDPMPPCLPGQVCTPYYEPGMAPEGLESLGLCTLPA